VSAKRRIIPIFVPHLGCMHSCVFCDQRRISGVAVPIGADDVRGIILSALAGSPDLKTEDFIDLSRPVEVAFYGGSFTALPIDLQESLLSGAQQALSGIEGSSIRVSTRPDCIDMQIVERLKHFGVRMIELGAQSMCDDVLEISGRGHLASDVVDAARIIKAAGVSLILQMMTGLPGDNKEKAVYSAEQIVLLKPDGVRIYPAVVIYGTELHSMWRRGDYAEHSVEDAVEVCAALCEIFDAASIAIIRLGLNPSDSLSAGDAVAGAYHPAFGELVFSRVCYNRAVNLLERVEKGSTVIVKVPKGFGSKMIGHKRENVEKLTSMFSLEALRVIETDEISSGHNLPSIKIERRG